MQPKFLETPHEALHEENTFRAYRRLMVYHSKFEKTSAAAEACGCLLLPLKTNVRGPAPPADPEAEDIIDEVLFYFKSNILFRNFEIKGSADRTLIYLTLYVTKCLQTIEKVTNLDEAKKKLQVLAWGEATTPVDKGFPFAGLFPTGDDKAVEQFKAYFKQAKEELGNRLVQKCYNPDGSPNKFWLCFSKRKFLNKVFA